MALLFYLMLLVTKLPPISHALLPILPEIKYGFSWYRDQKPYARRIFQRTRLALVDKHAGFRDNYGVECVEGDPSLKGKERDDVLFSKLGDVRILTTSGTTGRKKRYVWGPHFIEMNKFFFGLAREGDNLHKTVRITLGEFRDSGQENDFEVADFPVDFVGYSKNVRINVRGKGPVKGLKEALAGVNICMFPTAWTLLDPMIDLAKDLEPDALVVFTGEAMSAGMLEELRGRGIDARDCMRCWDGGATFFTCRYGNRHWADFLATVTIDNGSLICSDLFNVTEPHLNYRNGDAIRQENLGQCKCGLESVRLEFASRQDAMFFGTPTGQRANYEGLLYCLEQAANEVGAKVQIACFGCDPGGTLPLRVDYGVSGTEKQIKDLERAAGLLYRAELGYHTVKFRSGLDRFASKCKRMFYYAKE